MTPEKLAACPFCGGNEAVLYNIRDGRRVECPSCGAAGRQTFHGPNNDTDARAITAWNARALPQGYAAGVAAAAKVADKSAERHKAEKESLDGLQATMGGTRARHFCMQTAAEGIATAIRSLSSADAVVEGWRVTLSDAQRMVLGEAAEHDVQQADLFKTHATEDEKWRRIGLKIEIAINRLLELGA